MENNINQKFSLQEKLDISSPEKFIQNTDHFNSSDDAVPVCDPGDPDKTGSPQ